MQTIGVQKTTIKKIPVNSDETVPNTLPQAQKETRAANTSEWPGNEVPFA